MNNKHYKTYDFSDCNSVVVSGDIHAEFSLFIDKICYLYQMRDTLIIVAGDCGFGFRPMQHYLDIVKRKSELMHEMNNRILFVRGNHDNPAYYDGSTFCHDRFIAIPDYSVVTAGGRNILCIGGAISVDRRVRLDAWNHKLKQLGDEFDNSPLYPNVYWANEAPTFNSEALAEIVANHSIDTVITHTAPSFCELLEKDGVSYWSDNDALLLQDLATERHTMDQIFDFLTEHHQPISHWCYGHFHQSWHSTTPGTLFKMLNIMEVYELPQPASEQDNQ